jgi:hypothetical protein
MQFVSLRKVTAIVKFVGFVKPNWYGYFFNFDLRKCLRRILPTPCSFETIWHDRGSEHLNLVCKQWTNLSPYLAITAKYDVCGHRNVCEFGDGNELTRYKNNLTTIYIVIVFPVITTSDLASCTRVIHAYTEEDLEKKNNEGGTWFKRAEVSLKTPAASYGYNYTQHCVGYYAFFVTCIAKVLGTSGNIL